MEHVVDGYNGIIIESDKLPKDVNEFKTLLNGSDLIV
jgi:hypothetical protein